ncbi:MAG: glycerol-3-phosphate dehydrogenase [Zetaproteobacteria bacterium CG_4_9_14_3_um_filter_49_83]|nr:MAG: glycerol-3-phosphate dehydrogenase [Zetaproteobacteria bacterium CG1_02_49_23]PIQ29971.1 MAG: glycerol-3-phosphate dehydrogenase [Zetaproteobacteria bacterium CG17_big_fil_post_rev_8_21_14_2_50_50_13]PIV31468.1 MAG: glycerol-3-phosphate dehydrogenase [Zetaproteobacteria bacterium CG02_land_8_20_14_3_00_50_9]PIY55044.1 MAG: glycerol-3-phosphate dehydrogenase [Zetaproteobacteria bacterium CG_4_10_14_0_8_um_filter_49_80]PJA36540.1 MAG: glycerol-3-phosphate dehydrogenase [Zetaproteobacteria
MAISSREPVCVWGAGSWGTALAMVLSRHGRPVQLIARTDEKAARMQQARQNADYLPGIRFPDSLQVTADTAAAIALSAAIVVALPCSAAARELSQLDTGNAPVITACKGLDPNTLERVDDWLIRIVGADRAVLLSGPSFALDVAQGKPTALTMAAADASLARRAASFFDDSSFRIYTSIDVTGVALGGALKNVIAIAAGIAEGLDLGHNASAALVTRGIVEISRLAVACGGKQETLNGLSGLGDLVLTCTGNLSRNRKLGMALAQGMSLDEARAFVGQVVEGERSTAAACLLAQQRGIEMPIANSVLAVLQGQMSPVMAVQSLLSRPERHESIT